MIKNGNIKIGNIIELTEYSCTNIINKDGKPVVVLIPVDIKILN